MRHHGSTVKFFIYLAMIYLALSGIGWACYQIVNSFPAYLTVRCDNGEIHTISHRGSGVVLERSAI